MTERTDFQAVEDEEPEDPPEPEDPDELPWDDVDLDGDGAFAEGFLLCSAAVADVVAPGAFAEAEFGVCSSGVGVPCFDGDAYESRPGPSAPAVAVGSAFFVRDVSSVCLSVTTIAVTHTTIVVTASAPAR